LAAGCFKALPGLRRALKRWAAVAAAGVVPKRGPGVRVLRASHGLQAMATSSRHTAGDHPSTEL